jgi:hypothetical protein
MNSGKNFGSCWAATRTQRYPATSACEESASIDWAREMRGTASIAKAYTCFSNQQRDEIFLGADRKEADGDRSVAQAAGLFECQRSHRRHDVRVRQHISVEDVRARLAIGLVREVRESTGARLHDNVEPGVAQTSYGVWHECDSALARSRLGWHGHSHGPQPRGRPPGSDERPMAWAGSARHRGAARGPPRRSWVSPR